jgi:hypothetical protein
MMPSMAVRICRWAPALLGVALLALPFRAAAEGVEPKAVALVVISRDDPDAALVERVRADLRELAATAGTVALIEGEALQQRLGARPPVALKGCGADLTCIARLGARAKAQEIIVVRVVPGAPGIRTQFVRIGVKQEVMLGRVELDITSADESADRLFANFSAIFDVPPPGEEPEAVADAAELGDGAELAALPDLELAALQPIPAPASEPTTTADILLYTGVGVAGLGAVLAGIGGAIGANGQSVGSSITDQTPLVDALRREADANGQFEIANALFGVAGATAVIGGALIIIGAVDPAFLGGKADVSATASNEGASATLRLHW